jgi:hypothetical protein
MLAWWEHRSIDHSVAAGRVTVVRFSTSFHDPLELDTEPSFHVRIIVAPGSPVHEIPVFERVPSAESEQFSFGFSDLVPAVPKSDARSSSAEL